MENYSKIKVFILCGGKGTRLLNVVSDRPKPLALIAGKPFLDYLITFLGEKLYLRPKDIVFLTGEKGEMIREYCGDDYLYSHETEPLGTAGALRLASKKFPSEYYLVLNGDSLFLFDLPHFIKDAFALFEKRPKLSGVLALRKIENNARFGLVSLDKNGDIFSFAEKNSGSGWMNAGVYLFKSKLLASIGPGDFSLEKDIFTKLAGEKKLAGIKGKGDFLDIGTEEDFQKAQTLIPLWLTRVCSKTTSS